MTDTTKKLCPKCGKKAEEGYGLASGEGIGSYWSCSDYECDWFEIGTIEQLDVLCEYFDAPKPEQRPFDQLFEPIPEMVGS